MIRIGTIVFSLFFISTSPLLATDSAAQSNNTFALDLYKAISQDTPTESIFFSPYSIHDAFMMLYEGAAGATRDEMKSVLHIENNEMHAIEQLRKELQGANLHLADSLWIQKGMTLLPRFQQTLKQLFNATAYEVDFAQKPTEAQSSINRWVSEHTADKIKHLLQPSDIKSNTRLILVSAIYMQASWLRPFKVSSTKTAAFHTNTQTSTDRPFMKMVASFPYAKFDSFAVLELPYRNDDESQEQRLVMRILLPDQIEGLQNLENLLTPMLLESISNQLQSRQIDIALPKFRSSSSIDLKTILQKLGMRTPFEPSADFSGIAGTKNLAVDKALHKTFIDVDEKGTEAAAATAISINLTALPPQEKILFHADHPFIFTISDKPTETILFMGRIL